MFSKQYKTIIAVHDDDVYWFSGDPGGSDRSPFQVPLQQLLLQIIDDQTPLPPLPDWLKGRHKTLCIIPDHWFGSQTFPFQSGKASLIEPFLERKLTAAYPGQQSVRHFFNYRHIGAGGQRKLSACYFQDEKSFQLYEALGRLNHTPQHITAPAFLWEDALQQAADDFGRQGTLLVHLTGQQCQLYFYYQGIYQFSRSVMVADAHDGLDALAYEINQSLYMFSQTAKSELDCIYMLCESDQSREKLAEVLGREVIDLKPLIDHGACKTLVIPQLAILSGWLKISRLHSKAKFFSVMHRQVKRALDWQPVQRVGIAMGIVLLLGLAGEHFVLRKMYDEARNEYRGLQRRAMIDASGAGLSEYPDTLEQVLGRARRSLLVDAVHRMPAGFPDQVQLNKLELAADTGALPSLTVAALVQARNADELQSVLKQLMVELNGRFHSAQTLTLNDFDIRLNRSGGGRKPNHYQIEFALELT
ncbi:MAG: hypothetical protein PVI54_04025 [Desulfobacteraceae bacterium]|jgi:hypothetical protein